MHSVTFRLTPKDDAFVNALQGVTRAQLWRLLIMRILSYAITTVVLGYVFFNSGQDRLAWIFVGLMPAIGVWSVVSLAMNFRSRIAKKIERMYADKKNIALSVPSTASLFPAFIETSSRLDRTQIAWDVIEEILEDRGYLRFTYGLGCIFIPFRAFEDDAHRASFLEAARTYHHEVLSKPTQLTDTPPWKSIS